MLIEKISDDDLEFMETFYDPIALTESLFHDFDNLGLWEEEKFGHYRLFQLAIVSYEYLVDDIPGFSEKENYKLRDGAGSLNCFGGRKYGKSMCLEKLDIPVDALLNDGNEVGFCSIDMIHIRGILEAIIPGFEHHDVLKILNIRINRSPSYNFYAQNGWKMESVNMNLTGPEPGKAFFQKHFKKIYIEEASFEPEKVYEKRLESVSEKGCVVRVSGMTNFTKYSPSGRVFYDLENKAWIANHPQYVSPLWDKEQKEKAIKDHSGENSLSYRVFVKGEVVEEGISVFDMSRIRPNYDNDRVIKHMEINKDNFSNFENILIVERAKNASNVYIASDIGESAPTEIAVFFEVNGNYKYVYNMTVYNLTDKEQFAIFKYLIDKLQPNFLALDTTEGTGRAIFRSLENIIPVEHLVWVGFNEKISVGFLKDDNGNIVIEDGSPVISEEFVAEWSIKRLKDLLYENRISIPLDYRLDMQLNSVIATQSSNRTIYECVSEEDHLLAAFRVFAIAQWNNEFKNLRPLTLKTFFKGGV